MSARRAFRWTVTRRVWDYLAPRILPGEHRGWGF